MSGLRAMDVLYYTTRVETYEGLVGNANEIVPSLVNPLPGSEGSINVRRLTDYKFDQYTNNNYYLMYEGYRLPPKNGEQFLAVALYKEDLNIVTPTGSLHASCIYPDAGSGNETTISFTEFIVTGATGTFSGAKKILIEYSNDGTAPWARDGNNKSVPNARKMTLLGDAPMANVASQRRTHSLRSLIM